MSTKRGKTEKTTHFPTGDTLIFLQEQKINTYISELINKEDEYVDGMSDKKRWNNSCEYQMHRHTSGQTDQRGNSSPNYYVRRVHRRPTTPPAYTLKY